LGPPKEPHQSLRTASPKEKRKFQPVENKYLRLVNACRSFYVLGELIGEIAMPIGEIATATVAAVPAINSALTLIERVSKLVKGSTNLEAQEAVLQLREALLSVKEENLALKQENFGLTEKIGVFKNLAALKTELKFEDPVYYRIVSSGQNEGPYCAHCYGKQDKLTLLSTVEEGLWKCSVCKDEFETQAHRQRRRQPPAVRTNRSNGLNSWMER
jgi:ribosomal protein L37AE/L43A